MSQQGNPSQCVKCGAPVGTTGGRCPFCGTEQPRVSTLEPSGAAAVGLTDVNRARTARPSFRPQPKARSGGIVAVAVVGALVVVGAAAGGLFFLTRSGGGEAPATSASAPPPSTASPARTIGGVEVADAARVDPTDLLPRMRPRVAAWSADAKLLEIQVTRATNGTVNLTEPGGEIVTRFLSEKTDPRAPKGKEITRQRLQFVVKLGAGEPEQSAGAAGDKPAAEPNCIWSAAHRAAVKGGLPLAGPTDARYGWDAKFATDVWLFTSGTHRLVVDGNSCAIKG
ncbi:MAG: hypothetical protein IT374_26685 [Polyangiaceae bacterium]|nr:hypothetical protein [Polyangiaceae bacterium]